MPPLGISAADIATLKGYEPNLDIEGHVSHEKFYHTKAEADGHTAYAAVYVSHVNLHLNVFWLLPRVGPALVPYQRALREAVQDAVDAWPIALGWPTIGLYTDLAVARSWRKVTPGLVLTPVYPDGSTKAKSCRADIGTTDLLKAMATWP